MTLSRSADVGDACKLIRRWNDAYIADAAPPGVGAELVAAVSVLKQYLECEKADGKSITELDVPDNLLETHEGVQWVMPFVLSAESMLAWKRRKALSAR